MLRSYRTRALYKAYLLPLAGMVAGIVAVSLLIGVIRSAIAIPNLSVLYLLVVMFSAVTWGWWVALCSAVVAFLSYDFGLGNAYSYVIAFLTLALALLYMKLLWRRGDIKT